MTAISFLIAAGIIGLGALSINRSNRRWEKQEADLCRQVRAASRTARCPTCGSISWSLHFCTGHYYKIECGTCGHRAGNDHAFLDLVQAAAK